MSLTYHISMPIGDRWNDGHGRYENIEFMSNKTTSELSKLYKRVGQELKIDFSAFADGRGKTVPQSEAKKLKELGIMINTPWEDGEDEDEDNDFFNDGANSFVDLILRCMQKVDPTFEFGQPPSSGKQSWEPETLGYGLFMH